MPGTITFKLVRADLDRDRTILGAIKPYCQITIGKQKGKTPLSQKSGANPEWNETIKLAKGEKGQCILELKEKSAFITNTLGSCRIDLEEIENERKLSKWYAICNKKKLIGQILIESTFDDSHESSKPALMDLDLDLLPNAFLFKRFP